MNVSLPLAVLLHKLNNVLRAPQPQPPAVIATAMGASVSALAAVIEEMTTQIAALEKEVAAGFETHPSSVRSSPRRFC